MLQVSNATNFLAEHANSLGQRWPATPLTEREQHTIGRMELERRFKPYLDFYRGEHYQPRDVDISLEIAEACGEFLPPTGRVRPAGHGPDEYE